MWCRPMWICYFPANIILHHCHLFGKNARKRLKQIDFHKINGKWKFGPSICPLRSHSMFCSKWSCLIQNEWQKLKALFWNNLFKWVDLWCYLNKRLVCHQNIQRKTSPRIIQQKYFFSCAILYTLRRLIKRKCGTSIKCVTFLDKNEINCFETYWLWAPKLSVKSLCPCVQRTNLTRFCPSPQLHLVVQWDQYLLLVNKLVKCGF